MLQTKQQNLTFGYSPTRQGAFYVQKKLEVEKLNVENSDVKSWHFNVSN